MDNNDKMYHFTEEECQTAHTETLLCRMLSTKATLAAKEDGKPHTRVQIGKGQCGTIHTDKTRVFKTPNSADKIKELRRDARMHQAVDKAFGAAPEGLNRLVSVPRYVQFSSPPTDNNDELRYWIRRQDDNAIDRDSVYNYCLASERILPLQEAISKALLSAIYPNATETQRTACWDKPENNNCLVRLYLGRRIAVRHAARPENVSLRNFPLHVDEMERLGLPVRLYITAVAESLALMHWAAGVDANDVEFVLGSARKGGGAMSLDVSTPHHSVSVWLLDFNQCEVFARDRAGLKLLVDGFWWNDPYYPRPGSTHSRNKEYWAMFLSKYLDASALLTDSDMPKRFIEGVEEEGYRRRARPLLFG